MQLWKQNILQKVPWDQFWQVGTPYKYSLKICSGIFVTWPFKWFRKVQSIDLVQLPSSFHSYSKHLFLTMLSKSQFAAKRACFPGRVLPVFQTTLILVSSNHINSMPHNLWSIDTYLRATNPYLIHIRCNSDMYRIHILEYLILCNFLKFGFVEIHLEMLGICLEVNFVILNRKLKGQFILLYLSRRK